MTTEFVNNYEIADWSKEIWFTFLKKIFINLFSISTNKTKFRIFPKITIITQVLCDKMYLRYKTTNGLTYILSTNYHHRLVFTS